VSDAGAGNGHRPAVLTLAIRAYCHLCDDMLAALRPLAVAHGATIEVVDVDAHPALEAAWGDSVPALFLGAPAAEALLCRYHLDAERVVAALRAVDRLAPGMVFR
jgi:thioredoxin reductase (NADPH)